MFTGIIKNSGKIEQLRRLAQSYQLIVENRTLSDVVIGDSIAIDGVCLTVTEIKNNFYSFDISYQTVLKTAFSTYKRGKFINMEQALKLTDRVDGHILQGHVDTIGVVKKILPKDNSYQIDIKVDQSYEKYIVPTGSIAINGVSLTIANGERGIITLVLIPHSFKETNFKYFKIGDSVNVEFDFIAKYLYHFKKFPLGGLYDKSL